jgi:hypothetical protein
MPKDLIGGIRRLFAFRTERELAVETYHRHPPGVVYARAKPETVSIVETYSYLQEISRNRDLQADQSRPPTGRVRIVLPYDGDHYFTRQASSDVSAQLPSDHTDPTEALVGHVVLTNYGRADLGHGGNRNGRFTALPIRVPVSGGGLPRGYDHLIGDRASCVLTHDYRPDPNQPEILPVTVSITLLDPDSDDFLEIARLGDADPDELKARLPVLRTFEPYLELRVKIQVHVAGGSPDLRPEVSLVSIDWPKMTSLSSFRLWVSGRDFPIRYNLASHSLEWRDVPLRATRKKDGTKQATDKHAKSEADKGREDKGEQDDQEQPRGERDEKEQDAAEQNADRQDSAKQGRAKQDGARQDRAKQDAAKQDRAKQDGARQDRAKQDAAKQDRAKQDGARQDRARQENEDQDEDEQEPAIRTYESPTMTLFVQQPGELYREPMLQAKVDVRIPQLLSGMEARLYGGTGVSAEDCRPELVSEVSTRVRMILDDAFAERMVSASQHLHFEEVLPDPARIEDIRNALAGHGFQCLSDRQIGTDPYLHLLVYRRSQGPDSMELGYLIEGRRFTTARRKVVAGETLTTRVESGDLKIFGYGTLRTSSREVTRAMNELQKVLRPPFAHVRIRR